MQIDIQSGLNAGISEDCLRSFIEFRALKKAPITQKGFELAIKQAIKCDVIGLTPEQAIDETCNRGWTGVRLMYLANALGRNPGHVVSPNATQSAEQFMVAL